MKCPGQDMQYWNEDAIFDIDCPQCGKSVEFYKDDTTRKCNHCGNRFVNPKMDFGCAAYCQFAEQCLGTLPEEFIGNQDNLLKDKVAVEVKKFLKSDFRRIGHTTRVAKHAEHIGKAEGANMPIILCAAYLHDIAQPSGTINGHNTLTIARDILSKIKAKESIADMVCELLEQMDSQTKESQILADAKTLASLEEQLKYNEVTDANGLSETILSAIYTTAGCEVAQNLLKQLKQ